MGFQIPAPKRKRFVSLSRVAGVELATTCFKRPSFRARTAPYRNCTANSDNRPCATNDRVFMHHQPVFPCTARPSDDPYPSFLCDVHRKKFGGKLRQAENGTHSVYLYHVVYVTYDRCAFYGPSHVFSCKCRMASRYETCE